MDIKFKKLHALNISAYIEIIAKLRIEVFREFPYLYDGNIEYETKYLQRYVNAPNSLVIIAMEGQKVIGATTCLPLIEEENELKKPFMDKEFNLDNIFYFGESVILPEFQGNKIGHLFFREREEHAQRLNPHLEFTCFCAVHRQNHPLTPTEYRPLNQFWNRQGYYKDEDLATSLAWKDIDKEKEDFKKLIFWIKSWKK